MRIARIVCLAPARLGLPQLFMVSERFTRHCGGESYLNDGELQRICWSIGRDASMRRQLRWVEVV
jgi:hypothetical protein